MKSSTVGFIVLLGLSLTQAVPTATGEKKTLTDIESTPKTAEIIEGTPALAVEGAEEPKQADRAKKSASTTFCVEIRPGQSEAPVKVCDNHPAPPPPPPPAPAPVPQVPQEVHEIHEQPQPCIETPEVPIFVIPQNPNEVYIPNESYFPQIPQHPYIHYPSIFHHQPGPQHIIIPSLVPNPWPQPPQQQIIIPQSPQGPCGPSQQHIIIPQSPQAPSTPPQQHIIIPQPPQAPSPPPQQHIIIPAPVTYPQSPCPPSPCVSTGSSGLHPQALLALYRSGMASTDNALSSMDGMQMRSNTGNEASDMDSGAMMMSSGMESNQDSISEMVAASSARDRLKKLYSLPSSSYYPSRYYSQSAPYVVRCNPQLLSLGNGVQASSYQWGRSVDGGFNSMDYNGQPMNMGMMSPSTGHVFRRDQQRQQQPEQQQKPIQEQSHSREAEERAHADQKSQSEQSAPMSPSQMINQMRMNGVTSGFNKRPMLQTFPRMNEESPSNDDVNVNMNIPRGAQPFMISAPRNSLDEKSSDQDEDRVGMHDQMTKRQVEQPASD